jgi:hypothetical protein
MDESGFQAKGRMTMARSPECGGAIPRGVRGHAPWLCAVVFAMIAAIPARGDVLIYSLPLELLTGGGGGGGAMASGGQPGGGGGRTLRIALTGKVTVNPGRTVTYIHPTIKEPLYFPLELVEIKKVPTPQQEYNKRLTKAGKDADEILKAGVFALKRGLLREFHNAVKKALEADPAHAESKRITELKAQIDKPLPESPEEEKEIRRYLKRSSMRVARSNHFILLHDTPEKAEKGRKNRAKARLDLLEQVYESFLLLFHAQDVEIDIPRERMRVVLFSEEKDFKEFATNLSPSLSKAAGFWEPDRNVSVFYDHATTEEYKTLDSIEKVLKQRADDAKRNRTANTRDIVQFSNTLALLIDVSRENADIEVVSHEATHQMAGNTGLFPRHVMVPSWAHEGLATYFEAPGDATWAGIGAVNKERLDWYRALEKDREHSNIDFIVGDQIFDYARSHSGLLHGYGQAWALTHFLMETHLKEFVAYYRQLGEMPPDTHLTPEILTELFDKAFGKDRRTIDEEWRSYMNGLKTDIERLEEDE